MPKVWIAALVACLLVSPAHAGDPVAETKSDPLLEAVIACPISLAQALTPAYGVGRQPLRAEFLLDTDGKLLLRAVVRVQSGEEAAFEEWLGPVHAAGWIPRARELTEATELAEATAQAASLESDKKLLGKVLEGATRTEDRPAPGEVALSITPTTQDGRTTVLLRVGVKGTVRGLRFDPTTSTYAVEDPAPTPKPVRQETPTLHALAGADGTWFNVDTAPTFKSRRGSPILVVVTDPG